MKPDLSGQLLKDGLADLAAARRHLAYSLQQVSKLPSNLEKISEGELESVEAFTGRFARVVDLLVNKVLRSLDRVEMLADGSLLDVVNRAEKRGFVASAMVLREMKSVRNIIAHDYVGAGQAELFNYCRGQAPVFNSICDAVVSYAENILKK